MSDLKPLSGRIAPVHVTGSETRQSYRQTQSGIALLHDYTLWRTIAASFTQMSRCWRTFNAIVVIAVEDGASLLRA